MKTKRKFFRWPLEMKFYILLIFFISILRFGGANGIGKEEKDCNGCNQDYTKVINFYIKIYLVNMEDQLWINLKISKKFY